MAFCTKCGAANDGSGSFCPACGAALSPAQPGAAVAPPPAPQLGVTAAPQLAAQPQKKGMSTGKIVFIVLGTLIGLPVLGIIIAGFYLAATGADEGRASNDPCSVTSTKYLADTAKFMTGEVDLKSETWSKHWKPGVEAHVILSVYKFKPIDHGPVLSDGKPYKIPRVYYRYEVQEQIVLNGVRPIDRWDIVMEPDSRSVANEPCAIISVQRKP